MSSEIDPYPSNDASILIDLHFANFTKSLSEKIFYTRFFFSDNMSRYINYHTLIVFEILTLRLPWIKRSFVNNAYSSWDVNIRSRHTVSMTFTGVILIRRLTSSLIALRCDDSGWWLCKSAANRCFNRSSDLSLMCR